MNVRLWISKWQSDSQVVDQFLNGVFLFLLQQLQSWSHAVFQLSYLVVGASQVVHLLVQVYHSFQEVYQQAEWFEFQQFLSDCFYSAWRLAQ